MRQPSALLDALMRLDISLPEVLECSVSFYYECLWLIMFEEIYVRF